MAALPASLEQRLWILEAKEEIRALTQLYSDAMDRRDWKAMRSIFHPGSKHRHDAAFAGSSEEFVDLCERIVGTLPATHHHIGNLVIEVAGKEAFTQCYFTAHHMVPADASPELFPQHTPGVDEDYWIAGRYYARLECRNGKWGIVERLAIHDWERWAKAEPRGFVRSNIQPMRGLEKPA